MSYFIVFLAGILSALPAVIGELFLLPWFSLIPLFWVAKNRKAAYRHGLVFSIGYYGVLYHWFYALY
ncbi:MAG: hypothetical protein IJD10_05020, partial [Clostridia bacterium]|nr:hypothetical protein [Clostridia bacterium]